MGHDLTHADRFMLVMPAPGLLQLGANDVLTGIWFGNTRLHTLDLATRETPGTYDVGSTANAASFPGHVS